MYTIKQTPQDFIVEEIINLAAITPEPNKKYLVYKLTKSNETTMHCIKRLAEKISIEEKLIGFCGLKDKNATTSQYISIPNFGTKTGKERIEQFSTENVKLEYVGSSDAPLFIGALIANKFTIKVAGISDYEIIEQDQMINYFGEQRFSDQNEAIGKFLITKKFVQARDLIIQEGIDNADRIGPELAQYREKNPNDAVGALRRLNPKLLMLYIHAFQSGIWNRIASAIVKQQQTAEHPQIYIDEELQVAVPKKINETNNLSQSSIQIPLLGFDSADEKHDELLQQLIKEELTKEKMTFRDFISKEFPELTKSGGKRDFVAPIKYLQINKTSTDEAIFSFALQKGSYATVALRHILIPK